MTKTGQMQTCKLRTSFNCKCKSKARSKEDLPGNQLSTEGPVGPIDLYSPFDRAGMLYRRSTSGKLSHQSSRTLTPEKQEGHMAKSTQVTRALTALGGTQHRKMFETTFKLGATSMPHESYGLRQAPRCRQCHPSRHEHLTRQWNGDHLWNLS